jgi:hypothetical protein
MDEMVDLLRNSKLVENDRNVTVHHKCPGHTFFEFDPARPCPNCDLVGKPIARVVAEGKHEKRQRVQPLMPASEVLKEADAADGDTFED